MTAVGNIDNSWYIFVNFLIQFNRKNRPKQRFIVVINIRWYLWRVQTILQSTRVVAFDSELLISEYYSFALARIKFKNETNKTYTERSAKR